MLFLQMLVSGCGGATNGNSENKAAYTVMSEQSEASAVTMSTAEENLEEIKKNREVITLGGSTGLRTLQNTVDAFNNAQDKYWLELEQYESRTAIFLDITRKEGADIFFCGVIGFECTGRERCCGGLDTVF